MKVVIEARRCGKTTKLVEMVKKDPNGYIIVSSVAERKRIVWYSGIDESRILTAREVHSKTHVGSPKPRRFYVDNSDWVLGSLLELEYTESIEAISITCEHNLWSRFRLWLKGL